MKSFLIPILSLFVISSQIFGQSTKFNLKNWNKVKIEIIQRESMISDVAAQKLKTEIKLKLMTLGIKPASEDESSPVLCIDCDYIKSALAEQRVLVQMYLKEEVTTSRKGSIKTEAYTYYTHRFFKSSDIAASVYSIVMDVMVVELVEKYLAVKE